MYFLNVSERVAGELVLCFQGFALPLKVNKATFAIKVAQGENLTLFRSLFLTRRARPLRLRHVMSDNISQFYQGLLLTGDIVLVH